MLSSVKMDLFIWHQLSYSSCFSIVAFSVAGCPAALSQAPGNWLNWHFSLILNQFNRVRSSWTQLNYFSNTGPVEETANWFLWSVLRDLLDYSMPPVVLLLCLFPTIHHSLVLKIGDILNTRAGPSVKNSCEITKQDNGVVLNIEQTLIW